MNHIATGRALSLGENYSHMVMASTLDGEVDEEVQPGVETAARSSHGAAAASGGGPWPPSSFLVMVQQWRSSSPSLAAAKRRKIRGFWWLAWKIRFPFII